METLFWLEDSFIGKMVSGTLWGYPIVLSLHAIGMTTMVGGAMMLTVCVLGFGPKIPVTAMAPYWRVAVCGCVLYRFVRLRQCTREPSDYPAVHSQICRVRIWLGAWAGPVHQATRPAPFARWLDRQYAGVQHRR